MTTCHPEFPSHDLLREHFSLLILVVAVQCFFLYFLDRVSKRDVQFPCIASIKG
ncbi:hypothetical protein PHET_02694 [Paragonimus heterotremus]|uniref:Uncharacterized protein n=1 Tax=Paragonimus heterotremus TaxID=100268 RepID=A0A8J4TKW9_9TREM|nr:hypothetical protein PHET_02694 [Paragonimus heterotremus]